MAKLTLLAKGTGKPGTKTEGDPVAAYPDEFTVGQKEDIRVWILQGNAENDFPDQFYMIDIPGMPIETAQRILGPHVRPATVLDPEWSDEDPAHRYIRLGPYRWQFGVADKLPGNIKARLRREKILVISPYDQATIDVINSYVIDRNGLDVLITDTPIDP